MKPPRPSRTTGRLHFEDLDDRRFEDLCHVLLYPLNKWVELNHFGRTGRDSGRDIRAKERTGNGETREWIIQCKRYARITPKQAIQAIDDAFGSDTTPIDVFLLCVSCAVSKATLEHFQAHAATRGVEQAIVWDASFMESKLYNERKDLLFAFFGVNLREKSKNREAVVKRNLKLKRQMQKDFLMSYDEYEHQDAISAFNTNHVLIRDVNDETYPHRVKRPGIDPWFRVEPLDFYHSGIQVILGECQVLEALGGEWDIADGHSDPRKAKYKSHDYVWVIGRIPFDAIVVYNIGGDGSGLGPHILCRFSHNGEPFQEIVYGIPHPHRDARRRYVEYFDSDKRRKLP